jgi:hypothetical protein
MVVKIRWLPITSAGSTLSTAGFQKQDQGNQWGTICHISVKKLGLVACNLGKSSQGTHHLDNPAFQFCKDRKIT